MGQAGETLAAWFLSEAGVRTLARNFAVDGGEIDLLAVDGSERVAVEVRTVTGRTDPIDAIGEEKRFHVRSLASQIGADRVDFVAIRLDLLGFDVHWLPGG